jgi:hypothetical protein
MYMPNYLRVIKMKPFKCIFKFLVLCTVKEN